MDFGRAFSFVFDDPDWLRKVGIVALVSLIPLIGQFVAIGWALRITRGVIAGDPNPLKDVDFGQDLGLGFQAIVIAFVYAIPLLIILLPIAVVDSILAAQSGNDTAGVLIGLVSLCFGLVAVLYGILMAFVVPAAYGNFVAKGELSAGLRFGEVWGLVRNNPGAYLVVLAGMIVASFIAPLGSIVCVIGAVVTYAYAMAVQGHFYGQAYRVARGTVAPPPPPRPEPPQGEIPTAY